MTYKSEQFHYGCEVTNFLNENNIKQEDIINIYADKYFHHVIYVKNNDSNLLQSFK